MAAALMAVLVVVIALQFIGRSRAAAAEAKRSPTADRPSTGGGAPGAATNDSAAATAGDPWKQASLEDAIDYDPFTRPVAFRAESQRASPAATATALEDAEGERLERIEQARAARAAALDRLSQQGLHAFLAGGSEGNVAVIGTQPVRVGDVLNGFRVVAIDPQGIVVEPVEALEADDANQP